MYVVKHVGRSSDKKPESPMINWFIDESYKILYIKKKSRKKDFIYTIKSGKS